MEDFLILLQLEHRRSSMNCLVISVDPRLKSQLATVSQQSSNFLLLARPALSNPIRRYRYHP